MGMRTGEESEGQQDLDFFKKTFLFENIYKLKILFLFLTYS